MAVERTSASLRKYFEELRKNDNERKEAISDLKLIAEFQADIGENDSSLNEYIVQQELAEQKLDRALARRGF